MAHIERRRVKSTEYEDVPVEILDQETVRWWHAKGRCDVCQFDFELTDTHVVAIHICGRGTGDVLYLHQQCAQRAIKLK